MKRRTWNRAGFAAAGWMAVMMAAGCSPSGTGETAKQEVVAPSAVEHAAAQREMPKREPVQRDMVPADEAKKQKSEQIKGGHPSPAGKPGKAAQAAGKHAETVATVNKPEKAAHAAAARPMPQGKPVAVNTGKATKPAVVPAKPVAPEKRVAKAAPAAAPATAPLPAGDAARGAKVGRKCLSCHNTNTRRKVGPGLAGVFGRKVGQMPDMKYSPALAHGDWHWDASHLAAWVCNSKEAVRTFSGDAAAKTKMPPQRVCDPARQADLIAWLKTLK